MASISKIGTRWRAHIRKASQTRCKTFGSRALAKSWATTVEREVYPLKSWGGSKSADLKRLKAEFGNDLAAHLTHEPTRRSGSAIESTRALKSAITRSYRCSLSRVTMRSRSSRHSHA